MFSLDFCPLGQRTEVVTDLTTRCGGVLGCTEGGKQENSVKVIHDGHALPCQRAIIARVVGTRLDDMHAMCEDACHA